MQITANISDKLATQIAPFQQQLPQIINLGLRALNANKQPKINGLSEVLEFLATLPTPEEILKLSPSTELQNRINQLLEKNRNEGLSKQEKQYWQEYQYIEQIVSKTKINAYQKINNP